MSIHREAGVSAESRALTGDDCALGRVHYGVPFPSRLLKQCIAHSDALSLSTLSFNLHQIVSNYNYGTLFFKLTYFLINFWERTAHAEL